MAGQFSGLGGKGRPSFRRRLESGGKVGLGFRPSSECGKVRACGHIAIYHSPAYVFSIAMPLQTSFRLAPESGVVICYYGDGAGRHRFRLAPE